MSNVEREYEYKNKWTFALLAGGFFTLAAVVLGAKAFYNARGLILNGIIEMGPTGATVFYWVLFALSAIFVLIALLMICHRLAVRQRLVLGRTALIVPASFWSSGEKEIEYQDIQELTPLCASGQRWLYVTHAGGRHTIMGSMLPTAAAFDEICELLAARVREARQEERTQTGSRRNR
jgi:hypothetical protein